MRRYTSVLTFHLIIKILFKLASSAEKRLQANYDGLLFTSDWLRKSYEILSPMKQFIHTIHKNT